MRLRNTHTTIYLLIAIALGLGILGCESNKAAEFTTSYTYSFEPNQQLVINNKEISYGPDSTNTVKTLSSQKGTNIVFKYEKNVTPPSNVMDGGYNQAIYLEVPNGTTEFEFHDSELSQANTYFRRGCDCPFFGALPVKTGFLRGEKISGTSWILKASLSIESPLASNNNQSFQVEFDNIFIQK